VLEQLMLLRVYQLKLAGIEEGRTARCDKNLETGSLSTDLEHVDTHCHHEIADYDCDFYCYYQN
jgi:hypothetical protein